MPRSLLRRDMGGTRYWRDSGIHQEQAQYLAIPRLCRVHESEGGNPVLISVRESDASVRAGLNSTDDIDQLC